MAQRNVNRFFFFLSSHSRVVCLKVTHTIYMYIYIKPRGVVGTFGVLYIYEDDFEEVNRMLKVVSIR